MKNKKKNKSSSVVVAKTISSSKIVDKIDVLDLVENLVESSKDTSYRVSSTSSGEYKNLSGNRYDNTSVYLDSKLGSVEKPKFTSYSVGFFIVEEVIRLLDKNKKIESVEVDFSKFKPRIEIPNTKLVSVLKKIVEKGIATNLLSSRSKGYRNFIKNSENYSFTPKLLSPNTSSGVTISRVEKK